MPRNRASISRIVLLMLTVFCAYLNAPAVMAHELWVLTPDDVMKWGDMPKSDFVSGQSLLGASLLLFFAAALALALGLRDVFKAFEPRSLTRFFHEHSEFLVTLIRICFGASLIIMALGLEPRAGSPMAGYTTLFAPDIPLLVLGPEWHWLGAMEFSLGVLLVLGAATRIAAFLVLSLAAITFLLTDISMLAYMPALIGICGFLISQGGGRFRLIGDPFSTTWIQTRSFNKDLAFLRIAVGLNFLLLALYFKALQPNLAVAVLIKSEIPILSAFPQTMTVVMTVVEALAAVFLLCGIYVRAIGAVLLFAFIGFSFFLDESALAHLTYYGPMIAFILAGGGSLELSRKTAFERGTVAAYIQSKTATILCSFVFLLTVLALRVDSQTWFYNPDKFFVELNPALARPSIDFEVVENVNGKMLIDVDIDHFQLKGICYATPEEAAVGHAHLFINGQKVKTLYEPVAYLDKLEPGEHEFELFLNSGPDHRYITSGTRVLSVKKMVQISDDRRLVSLSLDGLRLDGARADEEVSAVR